MARQPSTSRSKPPVQEAGKQGGETHESMMTGTTQDVDRGEAPDETDQDIADLEAARLNAPDGDDDMDPDAERGDVVETETQKRKNPDDDILVRMLHEDGVHHVNLHPLEPGTVISMKRGEFEGHQDRGMLAEEVGDDYDGEVYDVSEPWKPEEVEAE